MVIEISNKNIARAVHRDSPSGHCGVDRWSAIAPKTAVSVARHCRNDATRGDLADAVLAIGDKQVSRTVHGHAIGTDQLCASGGSVIAQARRTAASHRR